MPGSSTKLQLPYPVAGDNNNVPSDMLALVTRLDAVPGIETLTTAARDALAAPQKWEHRLIYNSTTAQYEWWDVTAAVWKPLPADGAHRSGTYAARPAAAASNLGVWYYATDARAWFWSDGAAWTALGNIETMTTTQRDALVAGGKWDGRAIYNSTTLQIEQYVTATTSWQGVGGATFARSFMMMGD